MPWLPSAVAYAHLLSYGERLMPHSARGPTSAMLISLMNTQNFDL
jgi:hypothetical protein